MSAVDQLVSRIQEALRGRTEPLIVALDGHSGAGKTTLANSVRQELGDVVVIEGDDFYTGGRGDEGDQMSPADRALYCIDWRRQRPVLSRLRNRQPALWYPFDWHAFDGRLVQLPNEAMPAAVILLEGVYSARPQLHDLLDLKVLLATPDEVRADRYFNREGTTLRRDWSERWDQAERHYMAVDMPRAAFDLVLPG